MKCTRHRKDGDPCGGQAIDGTDACNRHAGRPLVEQRARGQVVVELRSWGLHDELVDSTQAMLRLLAQSYRRAEKYSRLLGEAYEAADRLRNATADDALQLADLGDALPTHEDNATDRERAFRDLAEVFQRGGVAALIGVKWGAAGKDGDLYQAEEAIRGLVRLESEERDRAFRFAKECRAANLDERLVRLAEGQSELVADYLQAVLTDLGHDLADPAVLRVLSSRQAELGASA